MLCACVHLPRILRHHVAKNCQCNKEAAMHIKNWH